MRPAILILALIATGCVTDSSSRPERGPQGTVAYYVKVESSDPGARVEVNDDVVGRTPIEIRVWGDSDGTFHNFGSSDFIVKVFPVKETQQIQTKVFRTGGWFSQEDRIPKNLYFDFDPKSTGGFSADPGKPRY